MITAMARLADSSRSISAAGSGTRMTSTLATIPRWPQQNHTAQRQRHQDHQHAGNDPDRKDQVLQPHGATGGQEPDVDATPEDIRFSGNATIGTKCRPRLPAQGADPSVAASAAASIRGGERIAKRRECPGRFVGQAGLDRKLANWLSLLAVGKVVIKARGQGRRPSLALVIRGFSLD